MSVINVSHAGGSFSVCNSFVDLFLKEANPSYIKVYLYILRHINANNSISLTQMASDTGLIKSDIISAFKYWDKHGVISYNNDPENINLEILNLNNSPASSKITAKETKNEDAASPDVGKSYTQSRSVASSYKSNVVVKAIHDDEKLAHLFSIIQQMLNKSLSSNDYKIIYSFIDYLKLPEQVIIILFEYCISMNKTSMRYIETIAMSWADSNITTVEAAESYVKKKKEQQSLQTYYKNKFKIVGRDLLDTEIQFLHKWVYTLKADEELIMSAYEKTVLNTGKVSFKYMNSIIEGEANASSDKNTGSGSKFKNYPDKYEISDAEKSRIEKMLAEFEGGDN